MANGKVFIYNYCRIGVLPVWGVTTSQNAFRIDEMKSSPTLGLEGAEYPIKHTIRFDSCEPPTHLKIFSGGFLLPSVPLNSSFNMGITYIKEYR